MKKATEDSPYAEPGFQCVEGRYNCVFVYPKRGTLTLNWDMRDRKRMSAQKLANMLSAAYREGYQDAKMNVKRALRGAL